MPVDQSTDEAANPVGFPARPAAMHVSRDDDTSPLPVRRSIWPLAPWRAIVLLMAIFFAVVCGIPAAEPVWNGADLGVLISLAMFVAAFTPGRN